MVFSWSGIGPESDGIRHEKTAELFDSLRFVRLCPIFVGLGCGKTGILTVGFLPSAPSGITEYVDIRSPESESFITAVIALFTEFIVLGARFRAYDIESL